MELDKVKTVGVIGAGLMGSQIAELFSRVGGFSVVMWDLKPEFVNSGLEAMETRLTKFFVEKGRMTADEARAIKGRVKGTTNMAEAAANSEYVVEVVLENTGVKKTVFKQLDEAARPDTILVSNTSYLNITDIASATQKPDRVAGMHFFNPVSVMKLVEVVRGTLTTQETVDLVVGMSIKLGKEPVVCKDFSYGFLANRCSRAMRNEAIQMLWERVAPPEDIDKAMRLGYNLPMGPLELGDFTGGWGIAISSEEDAMRELGPEKGRVHTLIRMMVRAGYTGGRSGKGVYAFWKDVMSKW